MAKATSSLQIVARVRGVFARHWMDLGLIIIMYSNNTVRLQGRAQKLQQAGEPVDEMLLNTIEQEIKRVKEVKRVHFNFENWVKTSSGWERVRERERWEAVSAGGGGVYTVEGTQEEEEVSEEQLPEEQDVDGEQAVP